ncbi:MAG: immunity 22 family protein [Campylobacteraceae bacterium]|jgi:hypothetical protein|nr:immunity 22 family protein [Campylobacteraceae bacterium]
MYTSSTERMKKIHIWMGFSQKTEEEYNEYFNQDNGVSLFYKDLNIDEEYDEDFIGIIPVFDEAVGVENILKNEIPVDEEEVHKALEECSKLNIKTVNAVFYLTDANVVINKPYKENYNGLKYTGE